MKKKKTIKEYKIYYSLFWLVRKKFPLILFAGYSVEKPNTQGKGVRKEKRKNMKFYWQNYIVNSLSLPSKYFWFLKFQVSVIGP